MQVTLVRHGETDYNVRKIIQGHTDIPLNARGEHQARYAAKYFTDSDFDAVYSSDLKRAVLTAELLTGRSPIQRENLREKWMGAAEGISIAEIYGLDRSKDPILDYGESYPQLMDRMYTAYNSIIEDHKKSPEGDDSNILIVAHGACLRGLIKVLTAKGDVDAGDWEEVILRGHKPFANCSRSVIKNNKLTEYATELVDADYADPDLV